MREICMSGATREGRGLGPPLLTGSACGLSSERITYHLSRITKKKGAGCPAPWVPIEERRGYGTVADQAEVSPDSKPSACSSGVVMNHHQTPLSASVEPLPLTARTCHE